MIKVHRVDKPDILKKKATEWTQNLLYAPDRRQRRKTENKYRHKEIKGSLTSMFHEKCAYCESKISHIDYGHIEHYRPKSRFPQLTFEWSNLLLACGVCNGARYKGDNFPDVSQNGPLVNPCDDEPPQHFHFHYDARCRIASVYGVTPRGKTTETLLGLNRRELRAYRSRQIAKLYVLAQYARTDPEAKLLFEEAKKDSAEYAAFARIL
jgi:uncharacterized protein (TIGR02646 family)